MSEPTPINVALDWTPNTIHTGLFVALDKQYYSHADLDVQLIPPDETYSTTPAKLVANGEADLAICPSESCVAYAESGKLQLQAIYAILQKDASAVVSTKYSRMRDLGDEGAVYGSYNARYEDVIVKAMVENDGGVGGKLRIQGSQGKLDLFEEVRKGNLDATWVFIPWEGLEAEMAAEKLHIFRPTDYGVPYGYSPVIARNVANKRLSEEALGKFVEATGRGYEFALRNVGQAVDILSQHCQPERDRDFLQRSQEAINEYYKDEQALGLMQENRWRHWVEWLGARGLLKDTKLKATQLFSNDFFTLYT